MYITYKRYKDSISYRDVFLTVPKAHRQTLCHPARWQIKEARV